MAAVLYHSASMAAVLLSSSSATAARHLVVYRAPSRHTFGFVGRYDLPRIELTALVGDRSGLQLADGIGAGPQLHLADGVADGAGLQPQLADGDAIGAGPQLQWIAGATEPQLAAAASRAILTHGAYSIVASASTVAEVSAECARRGHALPAAHAIDIVDLSQPNL